MKFSALVLLALLDIAVGAPLALSPVVSVKERSTDVISDAWKREEGVVSFQGKYNDKMKREEGVVSFQGKYNDKK